jgi:hypothetical protein
MLRPPIHALPLHGFPIRKWRWCYVTQVSTERPGCPTQDWPHSQEMFFPARTFHSTYETIPIRFKPTHQFLCSYWFWLRSPYRQRSFWLAYVDPDLPRVSCPVCQLLLSSFLIDLFFDSDDRGDIFLRNIELLSSNKTLQSGVTYLPLSYLWEYKFCFLFILLVWVSCWACSSLVGLYKYIHAYIYIYIYIYIYKSKVSKAIPVPGREGP